MSSVQMKKMPPAEIDRYIASDIWEGKAGGYGIQDIDSIVRCLHGEETNVMGLPMKLTIKMLSEAGIQPNSPPPSSEKTT